VCGRCGQDREPPAAAVIKNTGERQPARDIVTRIHVHELAGLKSDALATYLAALGALRLLAEQRDAEVRAFWSDEHFVLVTKLDWQEIERFFVGDYTPTPILAPWNMESGFFSLKPVSEHPDEPDETLPASGTDDAREDDGEGLGDDDEPEQGAEDETEQAVGDPLLDRFGISPAARFLSLRHAIEIAQAALPEDLRRAEEAVRRVHDEVRSRSADQRTVLEKARKDLEDAGKSLKAEKDSVEEKKVAAKQAARGASARADLDSGRRRLQDARERAGTARREKTRLAKKLRQAERRAACDPALKTRVAEARKRFKEVQSSTKERLIANLRARWSDGAQQWVDAAVALDESGAAAFTSVFGSGGNDGRMEFTRNFRQHLAELFDVSSPTGAPRENARAKLRAALFGGPTNLLVSKAVGQFFPGRAGGPNMGAGFSGGAAVNSWEFILMLEGAVALVAGMSRRGEVGRARVSSPFWVEAAAAGFSSASEREGSPRGEQWLPLWSQPVRYQELVELLREGRAQVGRRQTTRAGDLVRATARLGLARGIESLERFAYLQRNGKSNLAVSTGRFPVRSRSHQALLDEVAPWVDQLVFYARRSKENNVPASLGMTARRTQDALFSVCRHAATPKEWRALLIALGEAELALLRSGKSPARRPLPRLSSGWITAVNDSTHAGRCVLRLALALASQHRPFGNGETQLTGSIRTHFMPLDERDASRPRFKLTESGRPVMDPEHVCLGRDLVTDAIALVKRRSIWARTSRNIRERPSRLPLQATRHCEATLEEIGAWVRGEVSDADVLELARPLLALDWARIPPEGPVVPPEHGGAPEAVQLLFRLAHLPFDVCVTDADDRTPVAVTVRLDPEPLRRLAAGDLDGALRVTARRLDASGVRPVFRRGVAMPTLARRLAASLAFPISQLDAARAARLVCKPHDVKDVAEQPVPAV
jgi:CRISPR-associated protein Csx17